MDDRTCTARLRTSGETLINEANKILSRCSFAQNKDSNAALGVALPTNFQLPTGRKSESTDAGGTNSILLSTGAVTWGSPGVGSPASFCCWRPATGTRTSGRLLL